MVTRFVAVDTCHGRHGARIAARAHAVVRCFLFLRSPSILHNANNLPFQPREAPLTSGFSADLLLLTGNFKEHPGLG